MIVDKKLVLFDIDGTLYDDNKEMPISAKETLIKLQEAGHTIAIATGRSPLFLKDVLKETGITHYVALNGQLVIKDNEIIDKTPLNKEQLQQLEQQAKELGHPMVFFFEDDYVSNVEHSDQIKSALDTMFIEHPKMLENASSKDVYQSLIFHTKEDDALYDGLYDNLKFYRWHEVSRDVVPVTGSKAEGIKTLTEQLGFKQSETIAVGDGNNDFEMMQWAGVSIAMGNAVESLKEHADIVTTHVSDDGIKNAFIKLGMIKG